MCVCVCVQVGNLSVRAAERMGQSQVITAVNGQFPGPKGAGPRRRHGGGARRQPVPLQREHPLARHPAAPLQLGGRAKHGVAVPHPTRRRHLHVPLQRHRPGGHASCGGTPTSPSSAPPSTYGALIIRPRGRGSYPFPRPYGEATILLGEWWNTSVVDVERQAFLKGAGPSNSVALTINGLIGAAGGGASAENNAAAAAHHHHQYQLTVEPGRTYLLRIINAALNYQLFFKVANHSFTVVAADACYTAGPLPHRRHRHRAGSDGGRAHARRRPPGPPLLLYMAAQVYQSLANATYSATTTALLTYQDHLQQPPPPPALMPTMPAFNDSATAQRFYASLTGLLQDGAPAVAVPLHVDTRMLVTFGLGVMPCAPAQTLCNRTLGSVAASMNNVSFQFPTAMSLLEAHMRGAPDGVFTRDFPDRPPVMFDFTGDGTTANRSLMFTSKGTKVKTLR